MYNYIFILTLLLRVLRWRCALVLLVPLRSLSLELLVLVLGLLGILRLTLVLVLVLLLVAGMLLGKMWLEEFLRISKPMGLLVEMLEVRRVTSKATVTLLEVRLLLLLLRRRLRESLVDVFRDNWLVSTLHMNRNNAFRSFTSRRHIWFLRILLLRLLLLGLPNAHIRVSAHWYVYAGHEPLICAVIWWRGHRSLISTFIHGFLLLP